MPENQWEFLENGKVLVQHSSKESFIAAIEEMSSVMAVLYAPKQLVEPLRTATTQVAQALRQWGGTDDVFERVELA